MGNPRRERTKVTSTKPAQQVTCSVTPFSTPPMANYNWSSPLIATRYSYMVDTVGFPMNRFNPVNHTKVYMCPNFGLTSHQLLVPSFLFNPLRTYTFDGVGVFPENLFETISQAIPIPPKEYFDDFALKAESHFMEICDTKTMLLNFILEAIQALQGNIETLDAVRKAVKKAIDNFRVMFKKTRDYWLAWNFAIKPTINDIKNLLNSWQDSLKKLKWLRENNHSSVVIKYRQNTWEAETPLIHWPATEFDTIHSLWGGYVGVTGGPSTRIRWTYKDVKVLMTPSAHGLVRIDIPDELLADDFMGGSIVWMVMQGLYRPLDFLWEAMPFSWLIDWFTTERAKLWQRYLDLSVIPDGKVVATMHSLKWHVTGILGFEVDVFNNGDWQGSSLGPYEFTHYGRFPGLPFREDASYFRVPFEWYNASILYSIFSQWGRLKGRTWI